MFTKENFHRLIAVDVWLSIVLVGFKIVGTITWNWTIVLCPLWIPLFVWCLWLLVGLAIGVMFFITSAFKER